MIQVDDIVRVLGGSIAVVTENHPDITMSTLRFPEKHLVINTKKVIRGNFRFGYSAFVSEQSYTAIMHTETLKKIGRVTKWKNKPQP